MQLIGLFALACFRCRYSLGRIDRFYMLSVEDCLGSQNTSMHGLCLVHLHGCNFTCPQRCERHICEIETEDGEPAPCNNGTTGIHLSGYFFANVSQGL